MDRGACALKSNGSGIQICPHSQYFLGTLQFLTEYGCSFHFHSEVMLHGFIVTVLALETM